MSPRAYSGHAGAITSFGYLGNILVLPRGVGESRWREKHLDLPAHAVNPRDPEPDKRQKTNKRMNELSTQSPLRQDIMQ